MKVNIVRSVALILSVCVAGFANAQYGAYSGSAYNYNAYAQNPAQIHPSRQAPSPYGMPGYQPQPTYRYQPANQFQTIAQPAGPHGVAPAPQAMHAAPEPVANYSVPAQGGVPVQAVGDAGHVPAPVADQGAYGGNCATGNCGGTTYTYQPNVYTEAAAAPTCGGATYGSCELPACYTGPTQIQRFFGGGNILFLTRDDNYDADLLVDDAAPSTVRMRASNAEQDFALGYDVTVGSYIGCGKYAISATWLHIENGESNADITPAAAGDYRANFRNWDRLYYDLNNDFAHTDYGVPATDESLYAYFDRAERFYLRRDSSYYGIELNLTGFGIGGAARAGRPGCGNGMSCGSNACGNDCNCNCAPPTGCGGICGPMIPSCCCKLQMSWTTGFRWFHFEDQLTFSARSERAPAAPVFVDTFTYDVDAENEMFGWQFGGNAAYCCGCRTSVYAGAKVGIYANDASLRERYFSTNAPIYATDLAHGYPAYADQAVSRTRSNTGLASLAELDLGIGYRVCKCWTVRGGYRLLAASGVATALGNLNNDPAKLGAADAWADSNLILHGGYVGLNYNW